MRKRILAVCLCVIGLSAAGVRPSESGVSLNVSSGSSNIHFSTEPEVVVVPGSTVYYYEAPQYDVFRYGRYWYVDRGGMWYRARSYQGPFTVVRVDYVPRAIMVVPASYHRHDNGKHKGWYKQHNKHDQD